MATGALPAARPRSAVARERQWLALVAAVLTFGELCFLTWHYNPPADPEDVFPVTGAIAALGAPAGGGTARRELPYRIAASGRALPPDIPGYYGLEDIKTTDPIHDPRYARLLQALLGVRANDYNQQVRDPASPFFDFLNVRYVYSPPRHPLDLAWCKPIYSGMDGSVCENLRVLPRYFLVAHYEIEPSFAAAVQRLAAQTELRSTAILERLPRRFAALPGFPLPAAPRAPAQGPARGDLAGGTLRLLSYDGQSTRLAASGRGFNLVVSSDVDWPGWQIEWNGERLPALRVNGAFLGCVLPPGHGVLTLRYRPDEFAIASRLSACTAAFVVGLPLAGLGRRRMKQYRQQRRRGEIESSPRGV